MVVTILVLPFCIINMVWTCLTLQNITWYQHMHSADQVHTQVFAIDPSYNQGLTMEGLPVFLFPLRPRLRWRIPLSVHSEGSSCAADTKQMTIKISLYLFNFFKWCASFFLSYHVLSEYWSKNLLVFIITVEQYVKRYNIETYTQMCN